jgi:general secretion pathway protein G
VKRSFSLLEMIFIITIIAIISVVAIPKLFNNIDNANIIKLRADVALIRNGINQFNHKQILSNNTVTLTSLEDEKNKLFNKILDIPIIAQNNKSGNWSKVSNNTYKAWISSTVGVEFIYDKDDGSFDCDFKEEYCKDLTQ